MLVETAWYDMPVADASQTNRVVDGRQVTLAYVCVGSAVVVGGEVGSGANTLVQPDDTRTDAAARTRAHFTSSRYLAVSTTNA